MKVEIGDYPEHGETPREFSVEVSDHDIFSADSTLAIVILPVLKKLKETKMGSPNVSDEDVPEELRRSSGGDPPDPGEEDEGWHARWEYVLGQMIWAFEQIHPDGPDWEDQFYTGEADFEFHPSEHLDADGEPYSQMVQGPNHTLEFDLKGYQEFDARIENGLTLFGKYFRALWS